MRVPRGEELGDDAGLLPGGFKSCPCLPGLRAPALACSPTPERGPPAAHCRGGKGPGRRETARTGGYGHYVFSS